MQRHNQRAGRNKHHVKHAALHRTEGFGREGRVLQQEVEFPEARGWVLLHVNERLVVQRDGVKFLLRPAVVSHPTTQHSAVSKATTQRSAHDQVTTQAASSYIAVRTRKSGQIPNALSPPEEGGKLPTRAHRD